MPSLSLAALLADLDSKRLVGDGNPVIDLIVHDSRQARAGSLFVAIDGVSVDGHRFIGDAVSRGASAVVAERDDAIPAGVPGAIVPDGRTALARLAAAFYGYPSRRLKVIGITGTDGKTTTASLVQSILSAGGARVGSVTTVEAAIDGRSIDTGFHTTTPDALAMQTLLSEMARAGAEYAIVETTSHGLAMKRVLDVDYDVAAFTNVTAEHLDYHGTFDAYVDAKAMLFQMLGTSHRKPGVPKVSVLNADDPSSARFGSYPADRRITYGLSAPSDVTAMQVDEADDRMDVVVDALGSRIHGSVRLTGAHNVQNVLAAVAIAVSQGVDPDAIAEGLRRFPGVPGRWQEITMGQPFRVVVDFAHTPNSLEHVLVQARKASRGRVISVFGCAGLRDRQKRPLMGKIAGRLADYVVLTAEDPRNEDVRTISAEIAAGLICAGRRAGDDWVAIDDRGEAIAHALDSAVPGDLVLITGKGHEQSMCFGTTETPWNDVDAASALLRERYGARSEKHPSGSLGA